MCDHAMQALHYLKYSSASDVWSYGVLMYEIWSVGHKPYKDYANNKVGTASYYTINYVATIINLTVGAPTNRHRVSSLPSSWVSPGPL